MADVGCGAGLPGLALAHQSPEAPAQPTPADSPPADSRAATPEPRPEPPAEELDTPLGPTDSTGDEDAFAVDHDALAAREVHPLVKIAAVLDDLDRAGVGLGAAITEVLLKDAPDLEYPHFASSKAALAKLLAQHAVLLLEVVDDVVLVRADAVRPRRLGCREAAPRGSP